jgi:phosphatidylglycerophosphatase A
MISKPIPWRHPGFLIATFFGAGLLPKAPGTWGSIAGIGFAYLVMLLANVGAFFFVGAPSIPYIATIATVLLALTFTLGIWASNWYEQHVQEHDPGAIVIDEVFGQALVCLLAAPTAFIEPQLTPLGKVLMTALLFLLFRFFDIFKPWPINWFDRSVPGGLGVMVDDLVAAIMASVCFYVIFFMMADLYT